jgi:transposase InsO family protein
VAKWRKRASVSDRRIGPQEPRSTVLSVEDEAVVVAFRRHTLLPLEDCLYALQPSIPHLTRSSLHRCLQRHGISLLPDTEGDKPLRSKFKRYPIGYFHIDIAEVRTEQGKLHLFVAIDRTSKFAFVELHEKATRRVASNFLPALAAAVPYRIHTVLTDNGTHFTEPGGDGWTPEDIKQMLARNEPSLCHAFEFACAELNIDHRLTKPRHPWTNGQVERMNRTIKDATVERFHYESHDQLRQHLAIPAGLRDTDDDRRLVHIQPDKGDRISHGPSPVLRQGAGPPGATLVIPAQLEASHPRLRRRSGLL